MKPRTRRSHSQKQLMALSAAAMFGAATFVSMIEGVTPGGASYALIPGLASVAFVVTILGFGERLPMWTLATLGPIGTMLIALAIGTTDDSTGDGAVLYVWPALWMAYFFGRRGALAIVATVGVGHGLALLALPPGAGYLDRWVDVMVSVIVVVGVVCMLQERNQELLRRLAREARRDQLTGLLNRRGFEERAGIELQRAHREDASIAIVSFDIDHFKHVNDEWGHEAGDRVLENLAGVFSSLSRGIDVVARVGGEEFVALLPSCEVEDARAYADRVRAEFATTGAGDLPPNTLSAGVTAALAPAEIDPLLQRADCALYAAKSAGRDRAVVAESGNGRRAVPVPAPALGTAS